MNRWVHVFVRIVGVFLACVNAGDVFGAGPIVLQPHQKVPVEYLLKHPGRKGLLLFHSLGSGKTYVALDYTEKNLDKKVLILVPDFLKSNWISQMGSFGVKNTARYEIVMFSEAGRILKYNLENTIVIVDEVHKLVQNIRVTNSQVSERFISVYEKIKTAPKLLLLTGTPIFVDTSDISYIANLLDTTDQYPVDPIKFRTEYMRIKPVTSLVRGSFTESKLMLVGVPFFFTLTAVVTLGTALPWAIPLVALGGSAAIPLANEIFPANQVVFREFDADKWKDFARKYVSFFEVKFGENADFPGKVLTENKVLYNDQQANFFLNFVDEDMTDSQMRIMLADEREKYTDFYLKFHGSRLQKQLLANDLSGLEIGNLDFKEDDGKTVIEAPKFLRILNIIKEKPGQVAVYSNFYTNGIQRFAAFLDRHGMRGQYIVLSPDLSTEAQMDVVEQYNKAKKRILLIHPDITEGISLVGTEQFHILEPVRNATLLEQIIGRATRYRSHIHLPEERRNVTAYLWESEVEYSTAGIPTSAGLIRREHWQKNYSEVNPSMWTKGIVDIDSNYFLKDETPDARVKRHKSVIAKDVDSFKSLLRDYSIETQALKEGSD